MQQPKGYQQGRAPKAYGCQDYSLEMQLLQLQRRLTATEGNGERRRLEDRILEIEKQLGL